MNIIASPGLQHLDLPLNLSDRVSGHYAIGKTSDHWVPVYRQLAWPLWCEGNERDTGERREISAKLAKRG